MSKHQRWCGHPSQQAFTFPNSQTERVPPSLGKVQESLGSMRCGLPLSPVDFEVYRCMCLGDFSRKHAMKLQNYATIVYCPDGTKADLIFGQELPLYTRQITQIWARAYTIRVDSRQHVTPVHNYTTAESRSLDKVPDDGGLCLSRTNVALHCFCHTHPEDCFVETTFYQKQTSQSKTSGAKASLRSRRVLIYSPGGLGKLPLPWELPLGVWELRPLQCIESPASTRELMRNMGHGGLRLSQQIEKSDASRFDLLRKNRITYITIL
ncbi:hypothetical protein F4861DRAFT_220757 [Xylaria intraflava]|nr:hypothetical protein F4861DRAFT_220757 [Xylaria intraflava]